SLSAAHQPDGGDLSTQSVRRRRPGELLNAPAWLASDDTGVVGGYLVERLWGGFDLNPDLVAVVNSRLLGDETFWEADWQALQVAVVGALGSGDTNLSDLHEFKQCVVS